MSEWTVVIAPPLPWGAPQSFPAPAWPPAMPGDDRYYSVDITAPLQGWLSVPERVEVDVAPSGEGELTPWYVTLDGSVVRIRMFGGVPSRIYTVRVTASAESEQGQWLISLPLDRALASYPVPSPPNPDFGDPIMWPCSTPSYGPAKNLPAFTVAATGTTQLTAAPVPELAITLVNAGTGTLVGGAAGGVQLTVPIAQWNGYRPVFANRSGNPITLYLYGSDSFEQLTAGAGTIVQNDQTVTLSASLGGAAIIS